MPDGPNILMITSDQQRGDCYGFEGRKIKTPHLDRLARHGTRFAACITPNVVCQPSRASMLTGLLPRTHGVRDNGIDLDDVVGAAGFAGQFAKAGYQTGFIGKAHFSTFHTFKPTGKPENRASTHLYGPDWFGPYMGFNHVELMVGGHNIHLPQKPPSGQHYERWYYADGEGDRKNTLYGTHLPPDVGAAQTWHSALPPAWHNSTWTGDRTIAFLRHYRERPFILWASFPDPHHPFDAPEPWSRLHSPEDVDLPAHRALDLERRPWWHKASLESTPELANPDLRGFRERYSRTPRQTDEQLRHLIANYYGMISLIDHNVGRILIALDELGLSGNTIVIYTTDHGDWLGDHGIILKGPMMYEGLLRVGCILRGPGIPPGAVVGDPVSTLDLAATFYDYAGISPNSALHSRSLRPLIEQKPGAGRDFAYNEWDLHPSRCGVALRLRTVRTRRHKLTLELGSGAGELYDLVNDPFEMDNLFDDEGVSAVRRELTDMIESRPNDVMPDPPEPVGMA
ncbi:MAG: sulfatase-like hydrolase/transferase [Rhodospirillales bacterium]|nr:sulfatase-like hydrolase/transferase [Rhodospirillales bacterium]